MEHDLIGGIDNNGGIRTGLDSGKLTVPFFIHLLLDQFRGEGLGDQTVGIGLSLGFDQFGFGVDLSGFFFLVGFRDSDFFFSQGKYPTKLTYRDLPGWFLSGTYYGTRGYLRTNSIKGLWYQPCYHTNHMFKDDFLYISYQHPISSCPLLDIYLSSPDSKLYDEFIFGGIIPRFLRFVEQYSLYDCSSIWSQIEEKRAWLKANYPTDYRHEVLIPDTDTFSGHYHKINIH